jgi:hypothetical protein
MKFFILLILMSIVTMARAENEGKVCVDCSLSQAKPNVEKIEPEVLVQSCGDSWKNVPKKLIAEHYSAPTCLTDEKTTVYIYGENHMDITDESLRNQHASSASKGELYSFYEGDINQELKAPSKKIGLEKSDGAGPYTDLLLYNSLQTPGSLTTFFVRHKNFIKEIPRPFENPKSEELARKIEENLSKSIHPDLDGPYPLLAEADPSILLPIVRELIKAYEQKLLSDPKFAGIPVDTMRKAAISFMREMEWLDIFNHHICEAQKSNKEIWIQTGKWHTTDLSCILKATYGNKINFVEVSHEQVKGAYKSELEKLTKNYLPILIKDINDRLKALPGNIRVVADRNLFPGAMRVNLENIPRDKKMQAKVKKIFESSFQSTKKKSGHIIEFKENTNEWPRIVDITFDLRIEDIKKY